MINYARYLVAVRLRLKANIITPLPSTTYHIPSTKVAGGYD